MIIMPKAYILINCDLGYEDEVIGYVKSIRGICEVQGVFGAYDVVVKIETFSNDEMEYAVAKIRKFERIRSTLTLPVIEGQGD